MSTATTYGKWKVTSAELEKAKNIALGDDPLADANYQLVRYCRGEIHNRAQAEESLRMIRGEVSA